MLILSNGTRGKVINFENESGVIYPKVLFENGILQTIQPERWMLEQNEKMVASREQIPLKLAWGISVHKMQGQTLSRAIVSFSSLFEYGQVYVALSRVTSLQGLYLMNLDDTKIRVNPTVKSFYDNFSSLQKESLLISGASFKFDQVVRKREDRMKLQSSDCEHCHEVFT